MSEQLVVLTSFGAAFILDIGIMFYAYKLYKRMGGSGLLSNTTIYAGAAALVFGIHHILRIYPVIIPAGFPISEIFEGIAAVLLGIAVYELYKVAER
ncbi:MAG: hypothetical protein V3V92_02245 [Candidatus Hydrothermarchaeales archaeon]